MREAAKCHYVFHGGIQLNFCAAGRIRDHVKYQAFKHLLTLNSECAVKSAHAHLEEEVRRLAKTRLMEIRRDGDRDAGVSRSSSSAGTRRRCGRISSHPAVPSGSWAQPAYPRSFPAKPGEDRQPSNRDLTEAEQQLNQAYQDLRKILTPRERQTLKLEELRWLKERERVRNDLSENVALYLNRRLRSQATHDLYSELLHLNRRHAFP